jgi:methionyl-tRNA formyltransferase
MESVELVRDGKAPKVDQDHSQKTYESWCRKKVVGIDWSKPIQEVHNLVRGADPAPAAWTTHGEVELKLFDSTMVDGSGAPGEVLDISDEGMTIAGNGGAIRIGRVRAPEEKKISASEYAKSSGLNAGTKLG